MHKYIFTPALSKAGYKVRLVNHSRGQYPATGPFDPLATCTDSNTPSCLANSGIPSLIEETKKAIGGMREKGIAATQVDVVGHSLGGLLARATVKTTYDGYKYNRVDNYQKGDFHKIITIGTPHQGTRMADILVNGKCRELKKICKPLSQLISSENKGKFNVKCETVTAEETLETTFNGIKHPLGPAVYGLQSGSSAIKNIGTTPVPSHAIVGIASPEISNLEKIFDWLISAFRIITMDEGFTKVDNILGGNANHDTIVPAESQRGGLSGSAVTTFQNVDHLGEIGSFVAPKIADRVIELLQERPDASSFGYFSALSSNVGKSNRDFEADINACEDGTLRTTIRKTVRDSSYDLDNELNIEMGDSVCIEGDGCNEDYLSSAMITLEPTPETNVLPGQTIQIRLDITNGVPQEGAMISVGNSLQVVDGSPPYTFNYTVPEDQVGKVNISIQTFNSDPDAESYAAESSIIVNLPYLGIGYAVENGTVKANPNTHFSGGSSVEYNSFLRENTITTDQEIEVKGGILPQTKHAEQEVELLVVAFYLKEAFLKSDQASSENCNPALANSTDKGGYYVVTWKGDGNGGGSYNFNLWDSNLANLSPRLKTYLYVLSDARTQVGGMVLYRGQFEPGHACFYFGYRLLDGTLVFNGEQTINVRIKP